MSLENPMVAWGARYPEGRIERLRYEDEDCDPEDDVSVAELDSLVDSMGDVAADMQRILDRRQRAAKTEREKTSS